ncbi:hypothetical protein PN36_27820 [Candidatus Thiomargarita nelsonii]|uniref:Knr4/Smi1-like domain-containing protein n=1 Tax=Candidatus Thiomargarita nelsonii TaxID=1003181 RepID=A0A4E0QSL7_9GAMM|nr:hypothetical protein PN36_27820 [Candidatus Thiomargarita nelsonii]
MKRFIEFVSQYEPDFPSKIKGASDSEIMQFERLIGHPLPTFCRDYLSRMGHNHGGIDIGRNEAKTDIGTLIKYYEEYILPGEEEIPPESIVIAAHGYLINQISLQGNEFEPIVNFSDGEEIESLYAESLEKLLYQITYMKYHLKQFPFAASYVGSIKANRAEPAREIVLELGFEPRFFSDVVTLCADRKEASIWILQGENAPSASIAAQTRRVVEEIGQMLSDRAGLEFYSWGVAELVP